MTSMTRSEGQGSTAREALERGYQPIPIMHGSKRPFGSSWTHAHHEVGTVEEEFVKYAENGADGIGLLLGEPSGGLVDIDLDHPKSVRLRDYFLPRTAMRSGRVGKASSHYWYRVTKNLPGTRRYKMPDGEVSVELRSTGAQTVIPPSTWYPKDWSRKSAHTEKYRWEGEPWGGDEGPAEVDGRVLAVQVALLGMASVLVDNWPSRGSRHDAYLALAGGLLRYGEDVHPYWERNLSPLIRALALATHDDDGPDARESEVIRTTLDRLRIGGKAIGFPRLAEIIGDDHSEMVRRMAREVESLAGFAPEAPAPKPGSTYEEEEGDEESDQVALPDERDPLSERQASWEPVDLDPYLSGRVVVPEPSVLRRSDGAGLFYPGRVNSLYGRSESAKSWVALVACTQEMAAGERVLYMDLEDEPAGTLSRLFALGVGHDDIRHQFIYVRPEEPHARMEVNRWGDHKASEIGSLNERLLKTALDKKDPSLIIVDGMTVLYGLHGLDTNDQTSTDIITNFLKWLCRNGRSTVVVIDHIHKGGEKGAMPIGSQHKVAMVQGTALQVVPVIQPRPGVMGHMELVVGKDRPGAVRGISTSDKHQVCADVFLDSTEPGITRARIEPPTIGGMVVGDSEEADAQLSLNARLEAEVLRIFGGDLEVELPMSQIGFRIKSDGVLDVDGFSEASLRRAVQGLVIQTVLEPLGENRGRRYRLIAPPAEEVDDDPYGIDPEDVP